MACVKWLTKIAVSRSGSGESYLLVGRWWVDEIRSVFKLHVIRHFFGCDDAKEDPKAAATEDIIRTIDDVQKKIQKRRHTYLPLCASIGHSQLLL
eukprot:scaffold4396_cov127-Skeletonema_dohrnii-CCMP3373.AAC.9